MLIDFVRLSRRLSFIATTLVMIWMVAVPAQAQVACREVFRRQPLQIEVIEPQRPLQSALKDHALGILRIALPLNAEVMEFPQAITPHRGIKKRIYDNFGFGLIDRILFGPSTNPSARAYYKLSDVLEFGKRYNVVVTSQNIYLTQVTGAWLNDYLTKHYIVSISERSDVRLAGEAIISGRGEIIFNRYSGTFRASHASFSKAMQQLKAAFSHDIFLEDALIWKQGQEDLAAPKSYDISFRTRDIENIRKEIRHRLKNKGLPAEVALILKKVTAGETPNPDELKQLKFYRRQITLLRDAHMIFGKYNLDFINIAVFGQLLGAVNDALQFGYVNRAARLAQSFLKLKPIENIFPPASFNGNLNKARLETYYFNLLRKLSLVSAGEMSMTELHDIRLSLKKIMVLFNWLELTRELQPEELVIYRWMNRINDELGEIHDHAVQTDLAEKFSYYRAKAILPESLYQRIQVIGAQGNFQIKD